MPHAAWAVMMPHAAWAVMMYLLGLPHLAQFRDNAAYDKIGRCQLLRRDFVTQWPWIAKFRGLVVLDRRIAGSRDPVALDSKSPCPKGLAQVFEVWDNSFLPAAIWVFRPSVSEVRDTDLHKNLSANLHKTVQIPAIPYDYLNCKQDRGLASNLHL